MFNRSTDELDRIQSYIAIDLLQTMEEDLVEDAGKTEWEAFCGKYEQLNEDFRLEEVYMQEGKLYAKILGDDGEFTSQLYPIGEKAFGLKGGFARITFGENCLTTDGITCKKL